MTRHDTAWHDCHGSSARDTARRDTTRRDATRRDATYDTTYDLRHGMVHGATHIMNDRYGFYAPGTTAGRALSVAFSFVGIVLFGSLLALISEVRSS